MRNNGDDSFAGIEPTACAKKSIQSAFDRVPPKYIIHLPAIGDRGQTTACSMPYYSKSHSWMIDREVEGSNRTKDTNQPTKSSPSNN